MKKHKQNAMAQVCLTDDELEFVCLSMLPTSGKAVQQVERACCVMLGDWWQAREMESYAAEKATTTNI